MIVYVYSTKKSSSALFTEMLNSLRPDLSQGARNRVRHSQLKKKWVQNNRPCWLASFLTHNISSRPQNNKSAKYPHTPDQMTSLVGQFDRSADLCNVSKLEKLKHLSHHLKFTSQENKNVCHTCQRWEGAKRVFNFEIHRVIKNGQFIPFSPTYSFRSEGHQGILSGKVAVGVLGGKYSHSIDYIEHCIEGAVTGKKRESWRSADPPERMWIWDFP